MNETDRNQPLELLREIRNKIAHDMPVTGTMYPEHAQDDLGISETAAEAIAIEKATKMIKDKVPKMIKKELDVVRVELKNVKNDLSDSSNKNIETLGVFVALFTFISVEIQFIKSPLIVVHLLAYSSFLLGALILLVVVLSFILRGRSWEGAIFFAASIFLLGIGIYYINIGTNNIYYILTKDETNKMIDEKMTMVSSSAAQAETNFTNFENCVNRRGWTKQCFNENKYARTKLDR